MFPEEVWNGLESLEIGSSIADVLVDKVGDHIRDVRLNGLIKPVSTTAAMKESLLMLGLKSLKADPCIDDSIIEEE